MTTDNKEYIFAEIQADAPDKVQLMRTIKAEHGFYGTIELTKEDLRAFKKNFDLNKRRVELAVDYSHMSHLEAAGWIKDIMLENNDTELWIAVDWTETAREKIGDKQYKYLSADFSMKYVDEESGEMIGQMLHGAGLTNRPFIRGMKAIFSEFNNVELSEEQIQKIRNIALNQPTYEEEKSMTVKDIKAAIKGLSEDDRAELMKDLGVKTSEGETDSKQLSEANARAKKLEAENKELSEKIEKADKERKFDRMLSEGKAVEAQRDAYLTGDLDKFAELAEEMNGEEKGAETDEGKTDDPKTAEEAAAKLNEIANEIAEKDGIDFSEALSMAVDQNEKLYELSEGGKA